MKLGWRFTLFHLIAFHLTKTTSAQSCLFQGGTVSCGNRPDSQQAIPSLTNKTITRFVQEHFIKANGQFTLQAVGTENGNSFFTQDGIKRTTNELRPASVFVPSARCKFDGVTTDCPSTVIFEKTDVDGAKVSVTKSLDGNIESIEVVGNGKKHEILTRVDEGVFAYLPPQAYDEVKLRQYGVADTAIIAQRNLRGAIHAQVMNKVNHESSQNSDYRLLQTTCTDTIASQHVVKLAVVAESSFCIASGGTFALTQAAVQAVVNTVSNFYMQNGVLCRKVMISYLEIACDPLNDPYKNMVGLNSSGCGASGLLQAFQAYWNLNRASVQRDIAVLFTGTKMECSGSFCTLGCGYVGATCEYPTYSYSIQYVSFFKDPALRGCLVAHEIGHVMGSQHDPTTAGVEWIMEPIINSGANGFSAAAAVNITDSLTSWCIGPGPSTKSPTKKPTRKPTKIPTKSPTKIPTKLPTKKPTKAPTKKPTTKPTKVPTKTPTKAPTNAPTRTPTKKPTRTPTKTPTKLPTKTPTKAPTKTPTRVPTKKPTGAPTKAPTKSPTKAPTKSPTKKPTNAPTKAPTTKVPTKAPTRTTTNILTKSPTRIPTKTPTKEPTRKPTRLPTKARTRRPTNKPTKRPTKKPTKKPTRPTRKPTRKPTRPTRRPTKKPTRPTRRPTKKPTRRPTKKPTKRPTKPTKRPTKRPTRRPTS